MIGLVLQSSYQSNNLEFSFGKYHSSEFWSTNTALKLVSDDPFKRGDVVDIQKTHQDSVFIISAIDEDKLDREDSSKIGVLVPLASDVPLSADVDYEFKVTQGKADILTSVKCNNDKNKLVSYIVLALIYTPKVIIHGVDKTYNDSYNWTINKTNEFGMVRDIQHKVLHRNQE